MQITSRLLSLCRVWCNIGSNYDGKSESYNHHTLLVVKHNIRTLFRCFVTSLPTSVLVKCNILEFFDL